MKTLVILHGWQSSKEKWEKVKEILEKEGIEVLVPDLPGFKPETKLEKPWDLDDYVEWTKNFIEENLSSKKIEEGFFLLGHSFGGRISIKIASENPKFLKGLILVSAAGIKRDALFKKFLRNGALLVRKIGLTKFKVWNAIRKFFYYYILRKRDYLEAEGALRETIKNILREDLTSLLSSIESETLIVWGEEDKITPVKDGFLMEDKIKNSNLEILKDGSHIPYERHPEELAEKIEKFIDNY